jgi:hypothetical protein
LKIWFFAPFHRIWIAEIQVHDPFVYPPSIYLLHREKKELKTGEVGGHSAWLV